MKFVTGDTDISTADGLMNAIDVTMAGAAWQRCRVHYAEQRIMPSRARNVLLDRDFALTQSA